MNAFRSNAVAPPLHCLPAAMSSWTGRFKDGDCAWPGTNVSRGV